jgi:DNA-binding GntR family transcriptional regulator
METLVRQHDATLSTSVYDQLRHDILRGVLEPGQKLRINVLCNQYEAGGSPVREALSRLSAEGLVDRKEQRGFYVVQTSSQDLDELVRTRCWLEAIAFRESFANGGKAWRESLVLALHRLSVVPRIIQDHDGSFSTNNEWEELHVAFHRALLACCGSKRLIRYCDDMRDHAYRSRQLSQEQAHNERDSHAEHTLIVNAVIANERERAVELLLAHYQRTAKIDLPDA